MALLYVTHKAQLVGKAVAAPTAHAKPSQVVAHKT